MQLPLCDVVGNERGQHGPPQQERLSHRSVALVHAYALYRPYLGIADGMLMRGHERAGTQNDRLAEAVILSTSTPIPTQYSCHRQCRDIVGSNRGHRRRRTP